MNAEVDADQAPKKPRGRPRDPTVKRRAFDAVLSLYSELGFDAIGFDAVARRASVGKAALYSRWDTVEELLVEALGDTNSVPHDIDTGEVAQDLLLLARAMWLDYTGPYGAVSVRVNLDAAVKPELMRPYQDFVVANRSVAKRIVKAGIQRGELPSTADPLVILNLLLGSVLLHALFQPPHKRGGRGVPEKMLVETISIILAGVAAV